MDHFELCIAGAGVIGLAIAQHFSSTRSDRFSILLLDKNAKIGQETSSRNSEVIHAGLYYQKDSLKARLCLEGNTLLYEYCQRYGIEHRRTGKLIVAQTGELDALENLARRAAANGVDTLREIDANRLRTLEPLVKGEYALLSPNTGIIDSHALMQCLLQQAQGKGVQFAGMTTVLAVKRHRKGFEVLCESGDLHHQQLYSFTCTNFVNASGLQAHTLAAKIESLAPQWIPNVYWYKGNYFKLNKKVAIQHLVYPVPEASNLGLGIHASLDLAGGVRFGPDVEQTSEIDYRVDPDRVKSFASAIQRYLPWLVCEDLVPDYSGIRPKLHRANEPARDFIIQGQSEHGIAGLIQLFGIESPGLTASLAIARYIDTELAMIDP